MVCFTTKSLNTFQDISVFLQHFIFCEDTCDDIYQSCQSLCSSFHFWWFLLGMSIGDGSVEFSMDFHEVLEVSFRILEFKSMANKDLARPMPVYVLHYSNVELLLAEVIWNKHLYLLLQWLIYSMSIHMEMCVWWWCWLSREHHVQC